MNTTEHLNGPWRTLTGWPDGGIVALIGTAGIGKSTMAALLKPAAVLTNDQRPDAVRAMFERSVPGHLPEIYVAQTVEQVRGVLATLDKGPVVLDTLSYFNSEAITVAFLLLEWAKKHGARAVGILCHTRQAQYTRLPFDSVVRLVVNANDVRTFEVELNRWGPLAMQDWEFDDNGRIVLIGPTTSGSTSTPPAADL